MDSRIVLVIGLLVTFSSCSHYQKLEGNYFSKEQDCISFGDKEHEGYLENFNNGRVDRLTVKQRNNRLRFKFVTIAGTGIPWKHHHKYHFNLLSKNEDSFIVSPVSKLSRKFFDNRDSIVFKTKYAFPDKTINFEKIVYRSHGCGWFCPFIAMELDNTGNIKMTYKGDGGMDTSKTKYYRGRLSADDLANLKRILQYSQLRTVKWPNWPIADYSMITVILYHNTERLYFHGMGIPTIHSDLVNYFGKLAKHKSLTEINEIFLIEK